MLINYKKSVCDGNPSGRLLNHVTARIKIRKILSHKGGNVVTMIVGTFRSTEIQFLTDSHTRGLDPRSDIVLVHFQGSQVTSDVKKPV